ncbi:putative signal transducing protein [Maribacter algicola]|nr:DUF2007 domain-containing protein [Maribacter algicola]
MKSDYIKVFGGNVTQSDCVEQLLKENDISPIVKSESESARLAGFGTPLPHISEIFVHKDEEAQALTIISQLNWDE